MTKKLLIYLGIAMVMTFFYSCSTKETVVPELEETATCDDGILNGDEITVDCGGVCIGFCPLESIGILEGELAYSVSLDPEVIYTLRGPYLVRDKGQLNIPEGTIIKADPGSYIAIAQGGKLNVFGQSDNPVIFTSNSENPAPGDWGGIIICGKAPIQKSELGRTEIIDIFYGGTEPNDTSGVLRNLRIEYAGETVSTNKNFDGIAFYGVGSITTISEIQVFESLGNGIRFIGGNANANKLVVNDSGKNSIVLKNDWLGNGDSWHLKNGTLAGIEITSDDELEAINTTDLNAINNVSIIGSSYESAIKFTAGSGTFIFNNIYTLEMMMGIQSNGPLANSQIDMEYLKINNIQFENPFPNFIRTNYNGSNSDFLTENENLGSENKDSKPEWANGWTINLD